MATKVTMFFSLVNNRSFGWSETFYNAADTIAGADGPANLLVNARVDMLGIQTTYMATRIVELDANLKSTRVTKLFNASSRTGTDFSGPSELSQSDYPTVALSLWGSAGNLGTTRQWLRGNKDQFVVQGGKFIPTSQAGRTATNTFLGTLNSTNNGWGIRRLQTVSAAPKWIKAYDKITTLFEVPNHGWSFGQRIRVAKVRGTAAPYLNGKTFTVNPTDANHVFFTEYAPGLPDTLTYQFPTTSYGRALNYTIHQATWEIVRATSRQAGGSSLSPTGRQKTRTS